MAIQELEPTVDNLISSLKSDSIRRNSILVNFILLLDQLDRNYSIALDGPWGCGKTFFVKQAKLILDAFNGFNPNFDEEQSSIVKAAIKSFLKGKTLQPQLCVYYDAWANDNDDDPLMSLIYTICQSYPKDSPRDKLRKILAIGAGLIELLSSKNLELIVDAVRNGNDPYQLFEEQKSIGSEIKDFLDNIFIEKGNRMIIFIDELDRCNPVFAVKLLERIKHYFSNDSITFVFSTNISQLQHTIRNYYGKDFDALGYLDRFFNYQLSLPPANLSAFYNSIGFNNHYYTYDMVCDAVINQFNMSLRTVVHYLQNTEIAYNKQKEWSESYYGPDFRLYLFFFLPVLIGLKMTDFGAYLTFVAGKDSSPLRAVIRRFGDELASSQFDLTKYSLDQFDLESAIDEEVKRLYNKLFAPTQADEAFSQRVKNPFLEITSLLSTFSNY